MQLDSVTKKKYLVTCLFLWLCIVTWSVLKYTFITKGAMKLVVGYHRKRFCFPEWTVSQHIYTTLHWTSGNSLYVNPLPMVIWVVYCCGFFSVLVTKYIFWIFHFSIVLNLFNFSSELPHLHCQTVTATPSPWVWYLQDGGKTLHYSPPLANFSHFLRPWATQIHGYCFYMPAIKFVWTRNHLCKSWGFGCSCSLGVPSVFPS